MGYLSKNLPLVLGDNIADATYTPKSFLELYDSVKDDESYLNKFGMVELHKTRKAEKPNIDPVDLYQTLKNADYRDWDRDVDIIDMSKLDKLNEVFHDMVEDLDIMENESFDYSEYDVQELRDEVANMSVTVEPKTELTDEIPVTGNEWIPQDCAITDRAVLVKDVNDSITSRGSLYLSDKEQK